MKVIRSIASTQAYSAGLARAGLRIGFVPTMGALHFGHRTLIRAARLTCDAVVVSVFVNPTQFGPHEDFSRYPRQLKEDAAICRKEGVDVLFAPTGDAMYPSGFLTSVAVQGVSQHWEGTQRPTHFAGVATVVTKLLNIVRPHTAFFGQKDYQQLAVVRRLVADLNIGTTIMPCPTARESDGLAMSSRNTYLTPPQRRAAPILYAALKTGEAAIRQGAKDAARVRRRMLLRLAAEPLAELDYLSVCDPDTLQPVIRIGGGVVLLGGIRLGSVRLIDNVLLTARMMRRNRPQR